MVEIVLQWSRRLSTAETRAYEVDLKKLHELQWSRRLSTAETGELQYLCNVCDPKASMEPPSFDGGNIEGGQRLDWNFRLQWSRRLSTAETFWGRIRAKRIP